MPSGACAPTSRRRKARGGLVFLAAVAVLLLSAAVPASAATGHGVLRRGRSITPRLVRPHAVPLARSLHRPGGALRSRAHVRGGVPPALGGGTTTTGEAPLVSDARGGGRATFGGLRGALSVPGPLLATGNFANLLDFTGATFGNTCTETPEGCFGSEPPDTQMAAGQTEIVEAVNNTLFVFNRGGAQLTSYPLTAIFQPPEQSVGLTDPKILYDPTTGDFYMTEMVCEGEGCGGSGWKHMGISLAVSSDPAAGWTVYDYLNDGQDLQDQEKLGFSGDKITFAVNEYGCKCGEGKKFKQENVVVIQKADAVAANPITPAIFSANSYSSYIFDSMPTTPVNASTADNTQYVVWDKQATSSNEMAVVRITGTPNEKNVDFTGSVTKIGIADQTAPPAPVQPGGTIAGDKQNFQSAMVQGNDLWAVATDGCTPQYPEPDTESRDCTRLVEVNLAANSLSTDTDLGTDGTYRYNPSISKDSAGHVYFGFTISSATQFATAALDASALPLPAVLGRVDLASGDGRYTGGRWGDYSGTQQDPANTNDVWSAQEFGACEVPCSLSFGGNWATALGQFTFRDPHITSISPTEGPVTGGTSVDIHGSEFADGGTTVMFGANAATSVTWLDSTHIRAVSPPGSQGTVDVTASTAAGTSDTSSADQFTYVQVPTTTTYTGATSGDYNDAVTLSAKLTSNLSSEGVAGETLSFSLGGESCTAVTDSAGNASCTVTPLDAPGAYTVSVGFGGDATYVASNASTSFTVNEEESEVTYTGATTSHYHDAFTASATLTDPDGGAPIAGRTIVFTLGVGDTCTGVTDSLGSASCTLTPTQAGTKNLVAAFAGDGKYVPSSQTTSFAISPEETKLSFTGPTLILAGASGATLSAKMAEDGSADNDGDGGSPAPVPSETVTLAIGAQTCTGTTDTSGDVSCTIPTVTVPLGPEVVGASFAGDSFYAASSDSKAAIVFAFPSHGAFVLGDNTVAGATPTTTVTWWADTWSALNSLSGGLAPNPFKGFASTVTLPSTTPPAGCASAWTTTTGGSAPPPSAVPAYMGTLVTGKVTKSGSTVAGNTLSIVVVETDPGYAPNPVDHGTGRIVAKFC